MGRIRNAVWLIAISLIAFTVPSHAAGRIAFVIGNSQYDEIQSLPNPKNDANDVAERLLTLGFELYDGRVHHNLTRRQLQREIKNFALAADRREIAFFYYAGHGMQFDGDPHLLPADIPNDPDLDIIESDAISLNQLLVTLNGKADLTVAIFDACRDIPNFQNQLRSATLGGSTAAWRGLSRPSVNVNSTLIAYSGGSGQLVADGSGRNSPYTEQLLSLLSADKLQESGLDVPGLFAEVSYQFRIKHHGQQPEVINQGVRPNQYYLASLAAPKMVQEPKKSTGSFAVSVSPADARVCFYHDDQWQCERNVRLPTGTEYPVFADAAGYEVYKDRAWLSQDGEPIEIQLVSSIAVSEPATRKSISVAIQPEMALVRGGCYQMGSPSSEKGRFNNERKHEICVKDMRVATKETTVEQFQAFVDATGYRTEAERNVNGNGCVIVKNGKWGWQAGSSWRYPGFEQSKKEPVVCMSWNDAVAYTEWLSAATSKNFRLGTEAEWEYAARGGSAQARYWGKNSQNACANANVADKTTRRKYRDWSIHNCDDGALYTVEGGRYAKNNYGLYDMLGNAWEWTCSKWDERYSGSEGQCTKGKSSRLLRGGAWDVKPEWVRSASRLKRDADHRGSGLGFRVFQEVE